MYMYVCANTLYHSLVHACAYAGPLLHWLYRYERERYTKHCNVNKMADSSWLGAGEFIALLTF